MPDDNAENRSDTDATMPTDDPGLNPHANDWVPQTLNRPSVSGSQSYTRVEHDREPQYAEEAEGEHYVVADGDTLETIAARFYGSAAEYGRIFEANQDRLSDPARIYPGQELVIPSRDTMG